MNEEPLVAAQDDIGLLCLVIANGFTREVLKRLEAGGFGDSKFAHGFVIQGLLAGDRTVTELADRLGVSVQAVSKTVKEMEGLGYVERRPDPADGRSAVLELSERGRQSVRAARKARADVMDSLRGSLGEAAGTRLTELLRDAARSFGGLESLETRRVRPVSD